MIEPMTATPRAPPTWRVTSLIADPTPALAAGTALITASVEGAIAVPIETARKNATSAISGAAMSGVHARLVLSTTATPNSPPAMTRARESGPRPAGAPNRPAGDDARRAGAADEAVRDARADHEPQREREHRRA